METTAAISTGRDILEQLLSAAERRDIPALTKLVHPDVIMEWPQSGERFSGRENAIGAMTATEEKPELAGEPRIVGEGSTWTIQIPLRYGADIYHYAGIFELRDGLVVRSTEYFGAPFEAQPARAPYADRAGRDGR